MAKCLSKCIKIYIFRKKNEKKTCVSTLPKIFRPVTRNTLISLFGLTVNTLKKEITVMCGSREKGGGVRGGSPPLKNDKSIGFLSNIGPDHEKSQSYQASI